MKSLPDPKIKDIEPCIGYIFKQKSLLIEALTHKSYYHEQKNRSLSYNERLEFLGDAVIGLIVVEYLFQLEPRYSEAILSKIKSYIVSETVFAEIAENISLGKYILLGKGEESTGGREKKSILANTLEAVIGAIYLDSGFETVKNIALKLFSEKINNVIKSGEFHDYKTELQELTQTMYGSLPEYRVIKKQGEEHRTVFTVAVYVNGKRLGTASGMRKKEAETLAAKKAIKKLEVKQPINDNLQTQDEY